MPSYTVTVDDRDVALVEETLGFLMKGDKHPANLAETVQYLLDEELKSLRAAGKAGTVSKSERTAARARARGETS